MGDAPGMAWVDEMVAAPRNPPEDQPLKCEVLGGRLMISVGVRTLAHAFNESPFAKPYDEDRNEWVTRFKVSRILKFAEEVREALGHEEEDGTTPVHVLLDKACERAVEDGALGVRLVKHG